MRSSINGHFVNFNYLALLNNTALKMLACTSADTSLRCDFLSLRYVIRRDIVELYGSSILILGGISLRFSMMDVRACIPTIPTNNVWRFPFPYILINTSIIIYIIAILTDVIWWHWFSSAFIHWLVMLSSFSCSCCSFYVLFGKMSIQVLSPFLNWIICGVWLLYIPYIF